MSITIPRTFGRGIGPRKLIFVRLYSFGFAGASTGDVGGVTGAAAGVDSGADGAGGAGGAVKVIGATVALEIAAISLDFIRAYTLKSIGQAVVQP